MNEQQQRHAIQDIAQKTGLPEGEVKLRFDSALAELRSSATVEDYLIVLACKRVRDSLRSAPYIPSKLQQSESRAPLITD